MSVRTQHSIHINSGLAIYVETASDETKFKLCIIPSKERFSFYDGENAYIVSGDISLEDLKTLHSLFECAINCNE